MKRLQRPPVFSALLSLVAGSLIVGCTALGSSAAAQQVVLDVHPDALPEALPSSLPESPGALLSESSSNSTGLAASPAAGQQDGTGAPPKRLFGIVPNFRSVSTQVKLPPQTVGEKFSDATKDSFDYSSLALVSLVALEGYVTTATPEFGRGGLGYGRYLWHSAADQTIENYIVEFIIPVAAHEDTRFYTLTRGSFAKRAGYSLGRVFITRSDSGRSTFNSGEVLGAAAASGISNLYYPSHERTVHNFATKYATNIGIDAASYFIKEFYPEISHGFSHRKQQTSAP